MVSTPVESPPHTLRHIVVIWSVLLGILVGGFALTVMALNNSVFSASGFVSSYLDALSRHDVAAVLSTPGVREARGVDRALLAPKALADLDNIVIVSDVDQGGGIHLVSYSVDLGNESGTGAFQVQRTGSRFGVFSTWSFLQSPLGILRVTPLHDAHFTANGVDVSSSAGPSVPAAFQVFTPGAFTLSHALGLLEAKPVSVVVTEPGQEVPVRVDIRASTDFVDEVQKQVDAYLDSCITQEVLFPTGCPFGQELSNRVESTPVWSMARYPQVTIEPGGEPGTWVVPEAQGAAHLKVDVRSLFDGSLSTFDEDVQFALTWTMTIDGGRVEIREQG